MTIDVKKDKESALEYSNEMEAPKKTIGIADGKFRMPPDELLFDNEIADMFEDPASSECQSIS